MRVLITRPEREAAALATALSQRGHVPVHRAAVPPRHPPSARRLRRRARRLPGRAADQRQRRARSPRRASSAAGRSWRSATPRPRTAEGLGFSAVTSAAGDGAALAELVRQRLDPKAGRCCMSRASTWRSISARCSVRDGFEVRRFALYDAREESTLPDLGAGGAAGPRARCRHFLLTARGVGSLPDCSSEAGLADSRARPSPPSPSALPPLAPARRPAVQGDRRARRGRPDRPCWMRSTGWPKPAYKDKPS